MRIRLSIRSGYGSLKHRWNAHGTRRIRIYSKAASGGPFGKPAHCRAHVNGQFQSAQPKVFRKPTKLLKAMPWRHSSPIQWPTTSGSARRSWTVWPTNVVRQNQLWPSPLAPCRRRIKARRCCGHERIPLKCSGSRSIDSFEPDLRAVTHRRDPHRGAPGR